VIVPRLPDGRFLLLHSHRYAFDAVSLEFPRGSAEQNEEAESAARREMREETCLTPSNCEFIGYLRPDTAIVETEVQVFLMEIPLLAMVKIKLDEGGEGISSHELLNKQALLSKVQNGEIRDGFTIGAVGLLAAGDLL
jgi:8-oxo-dGTP pyrophosphatase MutT (NUDIX family)